MFFSIGELLNILQEFLVALNSKCAVEWKSKLQKNTYITIFMLKLYTKTILLCAYLYKKLRKLYIELIKLYIGCFRESNRNVYGKYFKHISDLLFLK